MKKKWVVIVLGVVLLIGAGSFVNTDGEQVAMNKAEFVS